MAELIEEIKTYNINEVEVFSAGEWNKDKYSAEDLHSIVNAFENLKVGWRPYLKLGHDDGQKLAKSSGLPSVGWVNKLYVRGDKLLADLEYIPEKIYKLIKSRAYRKVSCEIYWDLDVNGIKYPRVLGAIALLGAENPGVMNLEDILGRYHLLNKCNEVVFKELENQDTFKTYAFNFIETESGEYLEDLEKVKAELEANKKEYAKSQEDFEKTKSELAEKTKAIATAEAELKEYRLATDKAQAEAKAAKVSQFVTELESKKLTSPAMKDFVTELLSDKKEYSITKEKAEKKYTKEELITEILTLSKENAKVNFDESSRADFEKDKDETKSLDERIKKYSTDNKCSYDAAYRAVMKEQMKNEVTEE